MVKGHEYGQAKSYRFCELHLSVHKCTAKYASQRILFSWVVLEYVK
jgi:hypothetical protein